MVRSLLHNQGKIIRYTALVFLLLALVFFGVSLLVQHNADTLQRQEALNRDVYFNQSVGAVLTSRLSRIVSDLLFIRDSFQLGYFNSDDLEAREEVVGQWLAFANHKKVFDQIRYLDAAGNEVIRVDYTSAGAYLVRDSQLQNKSDRYYFTDTISLPQNHIYVSCMDLNVENGQIETPIKPVIRVASPVYTPSNVLAGIVVLNYKGNDLLTLIENLAPARVGAFYMLNSDSYWLYDSEDSARAWGFMYPDRAQDNFAARYPAEWDTIRQNASGVMNTPNGAFVYDRLFTAEAYQVDSGAYPLTLGSGDWYLVSHIQPDTDMGRLMSGTLWNLMGTTLGSTFYAYIMILFIAFVIALLMTANRVEQDTIKFYSEYDTMTGALNRRAGLELLRRRYVNSFDRRCHIGLCFLDINGLKEVNDTLGHDAGDELICSVTELIRKNLRQQDTLVRLGGDEFLIIFDGLDAQECEAVWQRIVDSAEAVNRTENRRYRISASHGIETFRCDAVRDVDVVLNSADAKMYTEKRAIKARLRVIREPAAAGDAVASTGAGDEAANAAIGAGNAVQSTAAASGAASAGAGTGDGSAAKGGSGTVSGEAKGSEVP